MKSSLIIIFLIFISAIGFSQKHSLNPKEMREYMKKAAYRTSPDYICYIPESFDGSTTDSYNEHFLVFDGPDGSLMAVWTQQQFGPASGSRIVFSRSADDGVTWSEPKHLAGPRGKDDPANISMWAFPMVSKSGRIYVLWNQNQGIPGWINFHSGTMEGMYSDDNGKTWSKPQAIQMPVSPYDDPKGKVPPEWIVWQNPERLNDGKYFVGYSRWVNEDLAYFSKKTKPPGWTWIESVVEFMRFENIDDNPEPKDIEITYSAWGDQALRVPHYIEPGLSVAQEPSIVQLPDGRLFTTLRSASGYIWYSVSDDNGITWCNPRPLLYKDHGRPLLQPVSCCPIYQLADGRYVLFFNNNRGDISDPANIWGPRYPTYIALGEFRPSADQPLWFSEPKLFIEDVTDDVIEEIRPFNLSLYSSFTITNGKNILWYPDSKCWLLGKEITDEFLKDLKVP